MDLSHPDPETDVDRDPLLVAVTAELLRARLSVIEKEFEHRYAAGGPAAEDRRQAILAAVAEAHTLAIEAVRRIK